RAGVDGHQLDAAVLAAAQPAQVYHPVDGVLVQVAGQLRADDRQLAEPRLGQLQLGGQVRGGAADHADRTGVGHRVPTAVLDGHRAHLTAMTRVPRPGLVSISNSSTSRRVPDRPSPSPVPVLYPSVSASSTFAMPGPSSTNSTRTPVRRPPVTVSTSTRPPPPWVSVLRASSLAAVTSLVWSTRDSRAATATARTSCRTRTTSSSATIGCTSAGPTGRGAVMGRTPGPARWRPAAPCPARR